MFDKKKKLQELREALRQDDAEQAVRYYKSAGFYDACVLAVENNASKSLKALFDSNEKYLIFGTNTWEKEKQCFRNLVKAAYSPSNPPPLLLVLKEANKKVQESGQLDDVELLPKEAPLELIQAYLEEKPALFDHCVKNIGLYSIGKLRFILTFTAKASDPQSTLDNALVLAAGMGDIEKAKLLLERQADPNYAAGQSLLRAGENGHQAMAALLLPLVKLDLYGGDIVEHLRQKGAPAALILSIEATTRKTAAGAPAQEADSSYTRIDADTLGGKQILPDGATLTTLFNFRSRQQQFILTPKDPVSTPAMHIISFDDIKEEVIKDMRQKLEALNGKPLRPRIHL